MPLLGVACIICTNYAHALNMVAFVNVEDPEGRNKCKEERC